MKVLLASAAAALVASSFGASAADLAKRAPVAVDYVKVCDAYGEGFFYIPGTETCLKIGGYVRADFLAGDGDLGDFGGDRDQDRYLTHSRLRLEIDARSQTEFGVLRAFGGIHANLERNEFATEIEEAYIQFAGLTAGKAQSFFDFFTGYAPAVVYGEVVHDDKVNLLAYTFAFGNGVTATLSLEDSLNAGREDFTELAYGGNKAPDIVGNIRIEQGWGAAQIMAVAHNAYGSNLVEVDGIDKWGWAVGGGVTVKLPMLGADDEFGIQAAYADGAIRYLSLGDSLTSFDFLHEDAGLSTGWSIFAGYQHSFSSNVVGAIQGGYLAFDSDVLVDGLSTDFNRWDLTASLTWTPVTNLEVTAFAEYRTYDFDAGGSDPDAWVGGLRLQRNF